MTPLEKRLISLQQKLEHLNTEIATLIALTASEKTIDTIPDARVKPLAGSIIATSNRSSSVGINRYHQLHATEGAL